MGEGESLQMRDMQSKAWSVTILLTGSQNSRFHTHTVLPSLPIGLSFIRGEMLF